MTEQQEGLARLEKFIGDVAGTSLMAAMVGVVLIGLAFQGCYHEPAMKKVQDRLDAIESRLSAIEQAVKIKR